MREAMRGWGIAFLSGILTTLSVPPFGWWPLAIVGLGLVPIALRQTIRARERFGVGFVFALSLYVPSLWWMTQFSLPGGIIIALIETVLSALVIMLVVPNRPDGQPLMLGWTAAVVGADALRSIWPFGGLPLGGIDLGQADGPFAVVVPFGGRLLLIGLVTLVGASLVETCRSVLIDKRLAGMKRAVPITMLVCIAVTGLLSIVPDGTHFLRTIRVAAVQGGGPLGIRATPDGAERAYQRHLTATEAFVKKPADLILWPENVTNVSTFATSKQRNEIGVLATKLRAPIVVGVVENHPNPKLFRNVSTVVSPGNVLGDTYEKVRRVPFGEYVFFRSFLERFTDNFQAKDMNPGNKPAVIATPFGPMAIIISYEGFFDDRARSGVLAGGRALLLPTNAASFTSAHLPTQQIAAARLRARETGRWVVQAAPTGMSAVLRPDGSVVERTGIQQRGAIQQTIALRRGLTPYARWNDAPSLVLAAMLGFVGQLLHRQRRRTPQTPAVT
jgi:apolipoprotein N-acyltransferase